jgi:hypothetical protein
MNENEARLLALAEARREDAERLRERLKTRNEQLERVCRRTNELADRHEALVAAHAVEAEATEALLGAAMDAALERNRS